MPTQSAAEDQLLMIEALSPMALPVPVRGPLVSVLMANYNYANYIGAALDSVLAQTYQHFEICICDDGSKDNSIDVIREYAARDPRVKFIAQSNGGHGAALNSAWRMCRGEVISLLDADDLWLPDKLESVVNRLAANPAAGFVTHQYTLVTHDLQVVKGAFPSALAAGWHGSRLLHGLRPVMPACSSLSMRREVAERIFPLDARFRAWADATIMDRGALITSIEAIHRPLARYRLHPTNTTGTSGPRTEQECQKFFEMLDVLWDDREGFAARELGIRVTRDVWHLNEAARHYLVRDLLHGKPCNAVLLEHLRSPRRAQLWRFLFKCPRPLATMFLGLRGMESAWKNRLKRILGI